MKIWRSTDARRRFSRFLEDSAIEPQVVELRGKPVGVTRDQKAFSQKSLARWLEDLGPLHEREGDLDLPPRLDRPDTLGDDGE